MKYRAIDEKKLWKDENTKDQWRRDNLKEILSRMKGWQLETFEESYNHKKKNGISLFKKNSDNTYDNKYLVDDNKWLNKYYNSLINNLKNINLKNICIKEL